MENYIINDSTIAILKVKNKTIIFDVNNYRVINKSINNIINLNSMFYGYTIYERKKMIGNIYNKKYNIPLYMNNNCILIPIKSLRNNDSLYIVFNKIINIKRCKNTYYIKLLGNYVFRIYYKKLNIEKRISETLLIINRLNAKK